MKKIAKFSLLSAILALNLYAGGSSVGIAIGVPPVASGGFMDIYIGDNGFRREPRRYAPLPPRPPMQMRREPRYMPPPPPPMDMRRDLRGMPPPPPRRWGEHRYAPPPPPPPYRYKYRKHRDKIWDD